MKALSLVAAVGILACGVVQPRAEVAPGVQSLPKLFDDASVVITGRIASVESDSEVDGVWRGHKAQLQIFQATLVVDRTYKGQVNARSITFRYNRPKGSWCAVSRCVSVAPGQYGLFFLKREHDGFHPLDGHAWTFAVSNVKSQTNSAGIFGLESDLYAGLHDTDESRVLTNVELIGSLGHVSAVEPLLSLFESKNATVRAAVCVSLLRLQDYRKLREALLIAESPNNMSSVEVRLKDQIPDLVSTIRDPSTAGILIEFSASPSNRLREAVIHALRDLGDHHAVPVFIRALDDPVELIRYDAVLGLASIEQNWELAPSAETFASDEAKYIAAWKSWWANSGHTND